MKLLLVAVTLSAYWAHSSNISLSLRGRIRIICWFISNSMYTQYIIWIIKHYESMWSHCMWNWVCDRFTKNCPTLPQISDLYLFYLFIFLTLHMCVQELQKDIYKTNKIIHEYSSQTKYNNNNNKQQKIKHFTISSTIE